MPTKKKRINIIPDNMPPALEPEDTCPSVYTGEKLLDKDPVKYARVVQELGAGKALTRIARENRISAETVSAIMRREKDSIDTVRETIKSLTTYGAQTALLRLIDKLEKDEVPVSLLPITFGILADKDRQNAGIPSQTIEVRKTLTLAEVKEELSQIKRDAIVVDVVDENKNTK
jgi:hypothetical protein